MNADVLRIGDADRVLDAVWNAMNSPIAKLDPLQALYQALFTLNRAEADRLSAQSAAPVTGESKACPKCRGDGMRVVRLFDTADIALCPDCDGSGVIPETAGPARPVSEPERADDAGGATRKGARSQGKPAPDCGPAFSTPATGDGSESRDFEGGRKPLPDAGEQSSPSPSPVPFPDDAQGKAPGDLVRQLMTFYQVGTVTELVEAQDSHIRRLQEKNPVREPIFPASPRHG